MVVVKLLFSIHAILRLCIYVRSEIIWRPDPALDLVVRAGYRLHGDRSVSGFLKPAMAAEGVADLVV